MSLGEEIKAYQRRVGYEEKALESREEMIEILSNSIVVVANKFKIDVDELMDSFQIPDEILEDVRHSVQNKL